MAVVLKQLQDRVLKSSLEYNDLCRNSTVLIEEPLLNKNNTLYSMKTPSHICPIISPHECSVITISKHKGALKNSVTLTSNQSMNVKNSSSDDQSTSRVRMIVQALKTVRIVHCDSSLTEYKNDIPKLKTQTIPKQKLHLRLAEENNRKITNSFSEELQELEEQSSIHTEQSSRVQVLNIGKYADSNKQQPTLQNKVIVPQKNRLLSKKINNEQNLFRSSKQLRDLEKVKKMKIQIVDERNQQSRSYLGKNIHRLRV